MKLSNKPLQLVMMDNFLYFLYYYYVIFMKQVLTVLPFI